MFTSSFIEYIRSSEEVPPHPASISSTEVPPHPASISEAQDETKAPNDDKSTKEQADKLVAEGKKAIALKQWEEGVNKYGEALDLMRQLVGEFDPAMAPLLLSYGKALYELAFSQQGVMGKEKEEGSREADEAVRQNALEEDSTKNGNFVSSADPTSDDEDVNEGEGENQAGPSTSAPAPGADAGGEQEEGNEDEPEDDYNAAWEVLDVARTIYQKIVEGKSDVEAKDEKLNLADCYLALGDVSCETENFPQAVLDYTSALEIQNKLLPSSSRSLASVNYQLATVLEFTPNRRKEALEHVEKALSGFKERLNELESKTSENVTEEVSKMGEKEKEKEINDVKSLIGDLEVKIEELKSSSALEVQESNDLVSQSINHLLGHGSSSDQPFGGESSSSASNAPVNDLTNMVKKKKPKIVQQVQNQGQNVQEVKKAVGDLVENTQEVAKPILEDAQNKVEDLKEKAEPFIEQVKHVASDVQNKVGEVVASAGESIASTGENLKRDNEGQDEGDGDGDERKLKKAKTE